MSEPPPRHAWSQATDGGLRSSSSSGLGTSTRISDVEDASTAVGGGTDVYHSDEMPSLVTPYEADSHLIPSLRHFPLSEVGTSEFVRTCCVDLERLAMTAHATATAYTSNGGGGARVSGSGGGGGGDEYVVEGLMLHDKIGTLVRICVGLEGWRTNVLFPRGGKPDRKGEGLAPLLASNSNVLRASFCVHAETTAVGLLNLALYRREGADELSRGDGAAAVGLVDYCARQMAALAVPVQESPMLRRQKDPPESSATSASELSRRLQSRTPLDELLDALHESEFKTCVSAVAAARYLCEHFDCLSLGAQSRILDAHDFPVLMVSLIEEPPWTRRRTIAAKKSNGEGAGSAIVVVWEKFVDNAWRRIPPEDLLIVTKLEAQPWLALYHLLCSNSCRERYGLDSYRKSQLLRVRKYLNDTVLDQLPVLADVMRYLDQLSLMAVPEPTVAPGSRDGLSGGAPLLLEQVDSLREELIPRGFDWDALVRAQFEEVWSKFTDATDPDLRRISEVYCGPSSSSGPTAEAADGGGGGLDLDGIVGLDRRGPAEPLSRPLEEVTLRVFAQYLEAASSALSLRLLPVDEGGKQSSVPTQYGLFVRIKMSVVRRAGLGEVGGDGDDERGSDADTGEGPIPVAPNGRVVATVAFRSRPPLTVELRCDDLKLPKLGLDDRASSAAAPGGKEREVPVPSSLPSREWRQLGLLEESRLVLQLGFKRLTRAVVVRVANGCDGGEGERAEKRTEWACYGLDRAFLSKPVDEHQ